MDTLNIEENTGLRCGVRLRRYYVRYTAGFFIIAVLAFSVYIITGKSLIWYADAWSQHYKALVYYAQYLRSILRTFISGGGLDIPNWDFSLGEGGDVLTTLHYYVIGDPLTVLSVFVPTKYIHILFDALSILRLYLSGAVFSYFCFFMGHKNEKAVAVGSFTYVFSYWAILNAGRHPYFLNPMLYFPLLLIGFELVMRRGRPYLLMAAVAVSAISNFYFFYMLAVISAFYVVCRLVASVRGGDSDVRTAISSLIRIGWSSVVGVMIAAVVLLPMCMAFLQDSRAGVNYDVGIIYPLRYYTQLPGLIAGEGGADYWLCAGFSVVAFPAVLLLFRRRGHGLLKFFAVSAAAAACIPFIGHALNGFSYVTNRWSWAIAVLASFIVVVFWEKLNDLDTNDYIYICIGESVVLILCLIFGDSRTLGAMFSMALAFLLMIILAPRINNLGAPVMTRRTRETVTAAIACISIVMNSLCFTSSFGLNYAAEHIASEGIADRLFDNETVAIKTQAAKSGVDGFFRYSGSGLTQNAGAIAGMSSTQYFWSLSNPNMTERNVQLGLRDYWLFRYSGCDGRTIMNTLSSVRYYVTPRTSGAPVPYGYKLVDMGLQSGYRIYENESALPLAYTYDTVIDGELWDTLSSAEKEEAMLHGVYVEDADVSLDRLGADDVTGSVSLPYTVRTNDDGITYEDGKIIVTSPRATATLMFKHIANSELFLSVSGFSFDSTSKYELYHGDDDVDPNGLYGKDEWDALTFGERWQIWQDEIFDVGSTGVTLSLRSGSVANSLSWYGSKYQFYNGRDNFTVNLGYHRNGVSVITITFPRTGVYTFDKMEVISRSVSGYSSAVGKLAEDAPDDLVIGNDEITGTITLTQPKMLLFAIPYSAGWRAYVDGEAAELYRANLSYMALSLDAGEHTVELRYETPYLRLGAYVSVAGVAAAAITAVVIEQAIRRKSRGVKSGEEA